MADERAVKDQGVCAQKLAVTNEALANCKGEDANHPKAKVVQKATEVSAWVKETVTPIINQVFHLNSNSLGGSLATME